MDEKIEFVQKIEWSSIARVFVLKNWFILNHERKVKGGFIVKHKIVRKYLTIFCSIRCVRFEGSEQLFLKGIFDHPIEYTVPNLDCTLSLSMLLE